jgi:hypothetical protein
MKTEIRYDKDADGVVREWTKTVIESGNVRTVNNDCTIKCEPGDDISDAKDEIKALASDWTPEVIEAYKTKKENKKNPAPLPSLPSGGDSVI